VATAMRSLGFSIFSRYDGSGVAAARRDIDNFTTRVDSSGRALNSWQGRIILATKAAAVFGPALLPLAANMAAVGGAATAMGATVGVAMGAYGLAIKNAIQQTNEMAKAGKALSAAQKDFITSQNAFNKALSTFGSSFRDESLKAASATLRGLTAILKGLEPVARALAPEVTKVAQAFEKWAKSPQFKAYVDMIKSAAVPAFRDLVAAGKDVLNVLGDGFRAFLPSGVQLAQTLRDGAAALRQWSDAGGFQKFLEYVNKNSGPVKEFFRALGDALVNVGKAMSELAPFSLSVVTVLLQLVAAMPPEWIETIVKGFVAWRVAMMAWAVATTVAAAAQVALTLAASPFLILMAGAVVTVLAVVAVLAALAVGIYFLVKNWDTVSSAFVTAWNATWAAVSTAVQAVWTALQIAWNAFINAFITAWTAVSGALVVAWNAVWAAMSTAVQAVWMALQVAWTAVVNAFQIVWTTVSTALSTAWSAFWGAIQVAAQAVWTALQVAWSAFITALQTVWTTVSTALTTAWSAVWTAMQTAAQAVWTALQIAWDAFINALQTVWNTVSAALSAAWSAFWTAMQTAAQAVWTALQTAWDAFINALQAVWNSVSAALSAAWSAFWTAMQTAAQAVWTALQTAWDALWAAMNTAWSAFSSAIQAAWSAFWQGIQTAAQAIWTALQTAWSAFFTAMTTAWNAFKDALTAAWKAFWDAITAAARAVWTVLTDAWRGFFTNLTSAWNTFKDALSAAWEAFWEAIKTAARAVWTVLTDAWRGFFTNLSDAWDTFKNAFEKAWEATWNAVKDIAKEIWGLIGGIIEKAINGVIGIINGLIKGFNAITGFLNIDVKIGEIGKVNLPGLADGGVVNFAYGGITGTPPGGGGCKGKGCGYARGGVANLRHGGTLGGYAPGRDTVPAMLSKGEGVLTPEAVRGLGGPGFVHGANREFAGHRGAGKAGTGFSMGGIQHFAVGGITSAALARAGVPLSLISQGEFSDGSLSGGTHLGGGAVDISSTDPAVLQRLIAAGFAAWIRGPEQGFSPHIHAVLMGHPELSGAAAAQVADFRAGGDGLGAGGGGGGGGILQTIAGMIKGHVGMILKNVYMGFDILKGVPGVGALMDILGIGDDEDDGGLFGTGIGPDIGPNVADAVGDVVGAVVGGVTGIGGDVMKNLGRVVLSLLDSGSIAEGLSDATGQLKNFGIAGKFGEILVGMGRKITDTFMPDFLMKKKEEAGPLPSGGGGGTGDVQQWSALAAKALAMAGISASQLNAFLALMQAESGGNPGAVNNTDINARNGVPSQGLMQVIPPTFAAFRDPSLPNNILDPLANMVAAARYIKSRYGGVVPGSPYADGTDSATPGLHLVGEEGPELVGLGGPGMAAFSGGQSVLPAADTASLLSGTDVPTGSTATGGATESTDGLTLPEGETQDLLNQGGFAGIAEAATRMAEAVAQAWREANTGSAAQWQLMRDGTMTEAATKYGAEMPAAALAMQTTSNAAWLDMNLQSATQWALMRDTTFTEAEFHLGTQMPLMMTTMQTAWMTAWLDMMTQATTQWTALLEGVFLPMEEHMGVTMVETATAMKDGVSEAFTAMGELITEVLDAGIAKMDEFIAKAQEAIAITAELVAAVAEAQAAMAAMASAGAAGAGGAGGGAGGSYEAIAAEALAAAGISADQLPAFMALMQAESGGDPNAVNNWDSNAAAGTPSMGLMQMIQPTFDAFNVTGGNIMDPRANMFASAAYIASRYGGIVPGSPYARGTSSATPGLHLVGENGPELVGTDGEVMAWFRGGERVLTNADTAAVMAQQALIPVLDQTIVSIDQFIAAAKAGIEKAKAMAAAAAAARAAGAGGVLGSGNCAIPPGATITQGPNNPGGVAASAGTHDGGGVYDFGTTDPGYLAQLHAAGFAAWIRGNGDGMSPHIHAVCASAPDLSPQAAWQVQDFKNGGSGLGIPALGRGTANSRGGWRWVGDRGPELMRTGRGDQVMPHRMSRSFVDEVNGISGSAHEGCGGTTIEINFNGPVSNAEDVQRGVDQAIPRLRSALQARSGRR
jgi:SLT domain-containing protein